MQSELVNRGLSPQEAWEAARSPIRENQPEALPFDPFYSRHEVEMMITADDGQRMLSAKRRNPDVIGWNRRSRFLEFGTDGSIGDSGSVFDVKDTKLGQILL